MDIATDKIQGEKLKSFKGRSVDSPTTVDSELLKFGMHQKKRLNLLSTIPKCVFYCQPTALLRASGSTQGG